MRVRLVRDLRSLHPSGCRIYIEEGCPRHEPYGVLESNQVYTVTGSTVKELRNQLGEVKSDPRDVLLIRRLAAEHPEVFREMTLRDRREIDEEIAYALYRRVTSVVSSLRSHEWHFRRQFGRDWPPLGDAMKMMQREKKKAEQQFKIFQVQVSAVGIRGLGIVTLAGIRAMANPIKFRSLSAYLRYCGLRNEAKETGRYNRRVRALYYQLACCVVMKRDPYFHPLYRKIKAELRTRFPGLRPRDIEAKARNRLSTLLAKKVYRVLSGTRPEPAADALVSAGDGN